MQCDFVQVEARDGVKLEGLVFSVKGADAVGVWIHGLTSNAFRNYERNTVLAREFSDAGIAFAVFNTRGHDVVTYSVKSDKRKAKGYRSITAGSAFERFEDSVLDLDAIVDYLGKQYKKVFLLGHSTGANKVAYYLARRCKKVAGGALISPVSDVSMIKKELGVKYDEAIKTAREMVKRGDGNKLVPESLCPSIYTARRLLSLADQKSVEQLFPHKNFMGPLQIFSKIKSPVIIVYGARDDYLKLDKISAEILINCFSRYSKSGKFESFVDVDADHSFGTREEELGQVLLDWITGLEPA